MTGLIPKNITTLTNHPSNPHLTYLLGVVLSQGLSFQLWPTATTLVTLLDQLHYHRPLRILELGFDTGLVDIVAATTHRANVIVTGLPYMIPNLQFNAKMNSHI
eukprot:XP_010646436.1 PREDICTED: uncharacterized protein LOC104878203 [Vitis vinifera]